MKKLHEFVNLLRVTNTTKFVKNNLIKVSLKKSALTGESKYWVTPNIVKPTITKELSYLCNSIILN